MESQSKELAETFNSLRDGRGMEFLAPYSPIFYWIGWLFVAYITLYGLAYYVAPAIFGYSPPHYYYPPPPYGRNVRQRRAAEKHFDMAKLAFNVLSQIDTFLNKINQD